MKLLNDIQMLAILAVANFDCSGSKVVKCHNCPYFAKVSNESEDDSTGCISIYLKHIVDKYYTERTDK